MHKQTSCSHEAQTRGDSVYNWLNLLFGKRGSGVNTSWHISITHGNTDYRQQNVIYTTDAGYRCVFCGALFLFCPW